MFDGDTTQRRLDYIVERVKEYRADGVLFCIGRYCDAHNLDFPIVMQGLKSEGIPGLYWEVDQDIGVSMLEPQLSAFFEMIKEGR